MDTDMQPGTELALPTTNALVAAFRAPDEMAKILDRIEADARAVVADVTTNKGRDTIRSLAAKVAKSKTHIDAEGKRLNEERRAAINAVDAERRKAWDRLEKLQAEVRKPLTDWEAAEKARVDALQGRVDRLAQAQDMLPENPTAEQVAVMMSRVEGVAIDDTWAEFVVQAATAKDRTLATLRMWLTAAVKREADAAELERLRAEAEARAEADRLRIEAEQAEAARVAAEKVETERRARIEQEARDRESRAAAEAEARVKADAEKAAQRERDRLATEAKAIADALAKREANKRLRAKVRGEIIASLAKAGTVEEIADALMNGQIAHCKVAF